MPQSVLDTSDPDSRLSGLIAGYLEAIATGKPPDREQMLADHPDLVEELQPFFDDHDWMLRLAGAETDHSLDVYGTTVVANRRRREPNARNGQSAPDFPSRTFGDYELLEEIGRGGMGVIYKARQRSLNRIVALKMIRSNRLASREEIKRFYGEAETVAALEHPGIVPIFEVGRHAGQHFYSMAYVEGLSLADLLLEEGLLDPRAAAELLRRVADAVSYAHQRGVIHRDLKPANILLSPSPAREGVLLAAEGVTGHYGPRVTDFGLAKRIESDSDLTGTGQVLGTPSYMPPEQAAGNSEEIGPLSDVYSLGAVLYCLLTGRPPFRSANAVDTLRQVIHDDPVPPRQVNTAVPRDLETICLKCLQKKPARRYTSARELGDDLKRFQDGEPLIARPTGHLERAWKWTRRRPTAATLLVVGLIAVMALVGLTVSYSYQQERERLLYSRAVLLAHQAWRDNEITRARELLDACPPELRGWEWDYVHRLCHKGLESTFRTPIASGMSIAYSHDGHYLAVGDERGPIRIMDAASGNEIVMLHGHVGYVESLDFSPDDDRVASGGSDGTLRLWDVDTGREIWVSTSHEGPVHGVAFNPDGNRLISGGQDGTLRLWNVGDGTQHDLADRLTAGVNGVAFSSDGRLAASAVQDGTIRLLNAEDLTQHSVLRGHTGGVNAVAFSPDGSLLASAASDGTVKVWSVREDREILTCEGQAESVKDVTFSPEGKRLASAGHDRTVRIWDVLTGRQMLRLNGHARAVDETAFHPDGRHVASTSWDFTVKIWNVGSGREVNILQGHSSPVRSVAFSPVAGLLASAGADRNIRLWKPETAQLFRRIDDAHDELISAVAFSPDGRLLASSSLDWTVKIWNVADGQLLHTLRGHQGDVYGVSFSPDGRLLASAGHDESAIVWETATGREQRRLVRDNVPVTAVAFSPDGHQLAVGGWDAVVAVWNLNDDTAPAIMVGHMREILSVAFSPDGTQLASGDRDGMILVWHANKGRRIATLTGHLAPVTGVVFSPDGDRIASTSWDGSVKVWDVRSEYETLSLNSRTGRSHCVAFSPDGRYVASANHDGTIALWGK